MKKWFSRSLQKDIIAALSISLLLAQGCLCKSDSQSEAASQTPSDLPATAPCVSWINPLLKPRAAVLCIHGLGLYSGAYERFGKRLAGLGFAVYAIDVRGFGSWMKANGHENVDFQGCLDDVKNALNAIHAANPNLPVFLLGESMGGAIALRAASMYPDLIDGLISSVPAGERFKQKRTDLKVALEFLKGPHHEFDIGSQIVSQATKNPQLKRDWQDNPLDRMDLSPKELIQFQSFMNKNHDAAAQIKNTPVLIIQGMKDKLVKPEGTWELFNEIASEEKVFLAVPGEHLIFENQQDDSRRFDSKIDRLVIGWLLSHMADEMIAARSGNGSSTAASAVDVSRPGGDSPSAADDQKKQQICKEFTEGKPTVIAFFAPWAQQCKDVDTLLRRAHQVFGNRIKTVKLNVDDAANRGYVSDLGIGPVPTYLFLLPSGQISSTSIGSTNMGDFTKGVVKIVRAARHVR